MTYRHDVYVLRLITTNKNLPNSIYLYEYVTSFFSESDEFKISNYIYRDNGNRNKTKEETRTIPREIPPRHKRSLAARERKARRTQQREIQFRAAKQLHLTQCIPR